MKKLNSYFLAIMLGGLVFTTACDKESVNPPAVLSENNVPNGRIKMVYSVQVMASNNVQGGKTSGVQGATVTVVTANGKSVSAPVGEDGIAIFNDIKPGTISGFVKATDHSSVNFTADLTPTVAPGDSDQVQFAASNVYIYKRNATLSGRVYGDLTFSGTPVVYIADKPVRVVYTTTNYKMGTGLGKLTSVSVEPGIITSNTDQDGVFSIAGLLPTEDGTISAKFVVDDIISPRTQGGITTNYSFRLNPSLNTKVNNLVLNSDAVTGLGDLQLLPNP